MHMKQKIHETLKSKYSIQVLDFLFSYPIFTSTKFIKETGIPKQSAVNLMEQLERNEIIIVRKKGKGRTPVHIDLNAFWKYLITAINNHSFISEIMCNYFTVHKACSVPNL